MATSTQSIETVTDAMRAHAEERITWAWVIARRTRTLEAHWSARGIEDGWRRAVTLLPEDDGSMPTLATYTGRVHRAIYGSTDCSPVDPRVTGWINRGYVAALRASIAWAQRTLAR